MMIKRKIIKIFTWAPFVVLIMFFIEFRQSFQRLVWDRKKMEEFELKELKKIISFAFNKSPFYNSFYKKAGVSPESLKELKDLQKFPVLTKNILRQAVKDGSIFTKKNKSKGTLETSTTGSSGDPLTLYFDFNSRKKRYFNGIRSLWLMGSFPDKRFVLIWRNKSLSIKQKIKKFLGLYLFISVVDVFNISQTALDKKNFSKIIDDLLKFNPQIIRGYTSTLWVIAQLVKKYNFNLKPEGVIACAEYLPPVWKKEMEEIFQCPVHNLYGGTEAAPIAASLFYEDKLMVFQDFYFTEIVNSQNNWTFNEPGRILITDFNSKYMPLIKYEIGDIAEWNLEEKDYGPLPYFRSVHGRINDIFVLPGGKILFSHNWHIYFREAKFIERFRVIQKNINFIEVYILLAYWEKNNNEDLSNLKIKIQKALGEDVKIVWKIVEKFDLDSGEKFRSVKSEVDPSEIIKNL